MDINQPKWKKPGYSRRQINDAGDIMRNPNATVEEQRIATGIIDNWRASHAYPLQVFYMNLRRLQGSREDIVVAQRLKRLKSITAKLIEQPSMELWRMHDLGGCRMVIPTVEDVYKFSARLVKSRIRHELKHPYERYDYIEHPKESGYRSLHLVYKFKSDTPGKEEYNKNMLIELQFRTHLQHIWATALETMGLFTHQALKAGHGSEEVLRFFALVSSLFAIKENCPVVPGTASEEWELVNEIKAINSQIHILDMLSGIRVAIEHEAKKKVDKRGYYILRLDYNTRRVRIIYFKASENEKAERAYNTIEAMSKDQPVDAVLVRATSMSTVRTAYPNYFLDIAEFVELLKEYVK